MVGDGAVVKKITYSGQVPCDMVTTDVLSSSATELKERSSEHNHNTLKLSPSHLR